MTTLHTISKAPASRLLHTCLPLLAQGDAMLFIEDGVYYCLQAEQLAGLPANISLYGLREDLLARGLLDRSAKPVEIVTSKKFVQLCCDHDKVINWF